MYRVKTELRNLFASLGLSFSICEMGLIGPNSQGWALGNVNKMSICLLLRKLGILSLKHFRRAASSRELTPIHSVFFFFF